MANNNGYPFITQNEVKSQLATSQEFRLQCLEVLVQRQTSDEQEQKVTKHVNKRGLRCSEAFWMVQLAAKFRNTPEEVTAEENERLARTLPLYRKQIAAHFRAEQLAANPELAAKAQVFGL